MKRPTLYWPDASTKSLRYYTAGQLGHLGREILMLSTVRLTVMDRVLPPPRVRVMP